MTQRPASSSSKAPRPSTAADLRRRLSQLDERLARLIRDRVKLVRRLANEGDFSPDPLRRLSASAELDGVLGDASWLAIIREIHSACAAQVQPVSVAFLGPEFSYSHLAAIERFGQSAQLIPVATIGAVFEAVQRQDVEFGIVPIENSTDGRIVDTLEMFVREPLRICGEVPMRIHHCLLGRGARAEVGEVHSKPQALSQCRDWLTRHLPQARLVPTASTTAAAQRAADAKEVAAIASRQAGVNYGLQVLASNIEDNPDNITRFAVIGAEPAPRTGRDKSSLMFELAHQPGALADAMTIFKRNRLNLTWIESFPKKGSQNEYIFFVELEGHQKDAAVRRAIGSLEKKTVRIEVLGSYARMSPIG